VTACTAPESGTLKAHNRPIRVRETFSEKSEVTWLDNQTYGVVYNDEIEYGEIL